MPGCGGSRDDEVMAPCDAAVETGSPRRLR